GPSSADDQVAPGAAVDGVITGAAVEEGGRQCARRTQLIVAIAALDQTAPVYDVVPAVSERLVQRAQAAPDQVVEIASVDQVDVVDRIHVARVISPGVELAAAAAAVDDIRAAPA